MERITRVIAEEENGATVRHILRAKLHFSSHAISRLTRVENGDVPSLPKVICSAFGQDYYELEEKSGELLENGETGARTVFDIAPGLLSPKSADQLRAQML